MIKKRISTILILLGIVLFCVPVLGTLYNNYQQDKMYAQYKEQLQKELAQLDETFAAEATDQNVAENAGMKKEPVVPKGVMGRIKIPAISSDLMLLEGTSSQQLRWGAGHVSGTKMPGETGNCSIAAHRDYTFGTYFSRLDELKTGNEIIVEYNGAVFKYQVSESFIVSPEEVSVLSNTEDASITLITCHPRGSGKQRLIVKGTLVT